MPRLGPHARGEVHLAPGRALRRPGRGDLGDPRALRRRRRGGLPGAPSRRWGSASSDRRWQRDPARGAEPTPPTPGTARLRQLGDLHAAAGRPGGRVRLGDRADRRRLPLVAAHGPGGRAPRAHGGHRGGVGAGVPAAAARQGWGAARHRLDDQGGQCPGQVGHPAGRPLGGGPHRGAGEGDDPCPYRGDAASRPGSTSPSSRGGRGGSSPSTRPRCVRSRRARCRAIPRPRRSSWWPGAWCPAAPSRWRGSTRVPPGWATSASSSGWGRWWRSGPRATARSASRPPTAPRRSEPRPSPPPRSPRSTRSPPSRWRRRWRRGPPSSSTWGSCGSRRSIGSGRWPRW